MLHGVATCYVFPLISSIVSLFTGNSKLLLIFSYTSLPKETGSHECLERPDWADILFIPWRHFPNVAVSGGGLSIGPACVKLGRQMLAHSNAECLNSDDTSDDQARAKPDAIARKPNQAQSLLMLIP